MRQRQTRFARFRSHDLARFARSAYVQVLRLPVVPTDLHQIVDVDVVQPLDLLRFHQLDLVLNLQELEAVLCPDVLENVPDPNQDLRLVDLTDGKYGKYVLDVRDQYGEQPLEKKVDFLRAP